MPYAPHLRVTALGTLHGSGEVFSYGVNMADTSNNPVLDLYTQVLNLGPNRDALADMASDIQSFHASAQASIFPYAYLQAVKFASIGADGKYTADPVTITLTPTQGGATIDNNRDLIIPQAALAISLTTARRGATGRGRFYIPMPVFHLDTGLRIPEAGSDAVATRAAALISALNNNPGVDLTNLNVVVASTKGYNSLVTGVRVGRVIDTIQSRRTSIGEYYKDPVAVSS